MKEKQKKFFILRAEGISFDKIAKELKISKQTAMQWSKRFEREIEDLKFQDMVNLKKEYQNDKKSQYKQLLKQLKKFNEAIDNIELKNTNIKDLYLIKNDISLKIKEIEEQTSYTNLNLVRKCEFSGEEINVPLYLDEI